MYYLNYYSLMQMIMQTQIVLKKTCILIANIPKAVIISAHCGVLANNLEHN